MLVVLIVLFIGTHARAPVCAIVDRPGDERHRSRYIMFALPLLFAPFDPSSPAGLAVYWITTNLWTSASSRSCSRSSPLPTPPTPGGGQQAAKPPPPPPRKKKQERRR